MRSWRRDVLPDSREETGTQALDNGWCKSIEGFDSPEGHYL